LAPLDQERREAMYKKILIPTDGSTLPPWRHAHNHRELKRLRDTRQRI